jgi:DNA-binding MarR family transcriptional regulator
MTSTSRRDLIRQVRDANHAIYRRIWHDTVADWIRLDLTMAQVKLLFVLRHVSDDDSQVVTISSVAQRLEIGLPAASHLVDRLVQQGLASRIEDSLIGKNVRIYRLPVKPSAYRFMLGDNSEVGIRW